MTAPVGVVIALIVLIAAENASAQRPPHRAWLISLGLVAALIAMSAGMIVLGRALPS